MKKRILVFPAGSEIGLEIHRSLKDSKHFELYGASSVPNHARMVFDHYIPDVLPVDHPGFITDISVLCDMHKIDFIYPAHDDVGVALALAQDKLPPVIGPDIQAFEVCRSKNRTYNIFNEISPRRTMDLPMFAKPDIGQGSKGAYKIETESQFKESVLSGLDLCIREYLPGPEYTVDCFTDRHGELRFCEGRIRDRISNGIAVETHWVVNPVFTEFAELISSRLKMRGAWFFQVKEDKEGKLKLLEIAPRIAGSSGLWRAHGVNLPELSLLDAMGEDVEINFEPREVIMSRALDNVFGAV